MKQRNYQKCTTQRSPGWLLLLLALWLLPAISARAGNTMEESAYWMIYQNSSNTIYIQVPVYDDEGLDGFIDDGKLYVTPSGGSRETVIDFYSKQKDGDNCHAWVKKCINGAMVLSRDGFADASLTTDYVDYELAHSNGQEHLFYIYVTWTVPDKYRGKTLEFSWYAHKHGNTASALDKTLSIDGTTISMSSAPDETVPEIQDPMVAYDSEHAGQIMIIYTMAESDIKSLTAYYKEVNGSNYVSKSVKLDAESCGYCYIDAGKPVKDFYIKAVYTDYESTERTTQSDPVPISLLHYPYGLNATVQDDGSVVVTWQCKDKSYNDVSTSDYFDVQRCTSGDPSGEDWTTIGQVAYSSSAESYSLTDEGFANQYEGKTCYYRVRRTSTALWEWHSGTYAITCLPAIVRLPGIASCTAAKGTWNDDKHEAKFTFKLGAKDQYDNDGRFILRTADDWRTLAEMVNEDGEIRTNVIMAADIDMGTDATMIGTSDSPYRGTFDGNGHTLTIYYDTLNVQYAAPFAYTNGATIKNLKMKGVIITENTHAGGVVGRNGSSSLTMKNVDCGVTIKSLFNGEAYHGGLVGYAINGTFENCAFTGNLSGSNSHHSGGFLGQKASNSGTSVTFTNCLFNPIDVTFGTDNSYPFTAGSTNLATITNCYYTIPFDGSTTMTIDGQEFYIIRTADDFKEFGNKVKTAAGSSDVNAIMANDVTCEDYYVGESSYPFRGKFYGNGHTLYVKLDQSGVQYCAPFHYAKNYTIRDLHVAGSVYGGLHTSGLVGLSQGSHNYIYNCRVSVDLSCSSTHAGGFVGHGDTTPHDISNCRFDGTLTYDSNSSSNRFGAFMGWDNNDNISTNACNNLLEASGYYENNENGQMQMNFSKTNYYGGSSNYSKSGWTNTATDASNLSESDLLGYLGSDNWEISSANVVPKATGKKEVSQGVDAYDLSITQLADTLGTQWEQMGNSAVVTLDYSDDEQYATPVWQTGARVVLNIDKYVADSLAYTETKQLSDDERKTGTYDADLTTSCVDYQFSFSIDQNTANLEPMDTLGTAAVSSDESYYYHNNVQIDSLAMTTRLTSVVLQWEVSGIADYYRITRRDKLTEEVDSLETEYLQTSYTDKTVCPQHTYEYTIEGVTDCEGLNVSTSKIDGWCQSTGTVKGYLRLSDGTGQGGVTVTATPDDDETIAAGGTTSTTVSDASGYYEINNLIYNGSGSYKITAEAAGDAGQYTQYTASFNDNPGGNLVSNANLKLQNYYILSGYVMFDGSSIPVVGASFEVDGQEVHNGSGKTVTTNSLGEFSISLSKGQHKVKVKKDGHVFMYDGYYVDALDTTKIENNWQKSKSGHVFWDKTKVTLQGRVVGGEVQGSKPLGELASYNNLGDSITLVMKLEGDNASWIVRDQLDDGVKERHNDYTFATADKDTCHVDAYRYYMQINPSNTTGEYSIPIYPVKWKITQIYCQGYSSLFQSGTVSETLDLSDYVKGDTVEYSRTYHATPTLAVNQYNADGKDYMGIKSYTETDNTGKQAKVELWHETDENSPADDNGYSFGYPVFMSGSPIVMMMSAQEQYYYNGNESDEPDVVQLPGGEVRVQNALVEEGASETLELDSVGQYIYTFTPQNLTFTEEGDMALKTMNLTLLYDGTYYDITPMDGEPIRGFVLASKKKTQGKTVLADGGTYLIDILRDPPGANSSAYIENGTRLNYSFSQQYKWTTGIHLEIGNRTNQSDRYIGTFTGTTKQDNSITGSENGDNVTVKTMPITQTDVTVGYFHSWQFNYSFETSERISTSGGGMNSVGPDADVFIGMTQEAQMSEAVAVRAVGEETYQRLTAHAGGSFTVDGATFTVPEGTMKLIAQGKNSNGENVYIIRDEVLSLSTHLKSTFAHSQFYIENTLIPDLINWRNSLILAEGTDSLTALAIANNKGCAQYISKVPADNEYFGNYGYYKVIYPTNSDERNDSVNHINEQLATWIGFLYLNEKEKVQASELVKSYDVDGRSPVSYAEGFGTTLNQGASFTIPLSTSVSASILGPLGLWNTKPQSTRDVIDPDRVEEKGKKKEIEISVFKTGVYVSTTPIGNLAYNQDFGKSEAETKRIGFNLSPSTNSQLVVNVYRTPSRKKELQQEFEEMKAAGYTDDELDELFFQRTAWDYMDYVKYGYGYGKAASAGGAWASFAQSDGDITEYRNLVYRTKGGITAGPYEDERKTKYYHPGTLLDEKTVPIDNLKLWADQPSVSNVPYDEPARFTLHFVNDTEYPNIATMMLNVSIKDGSNPTGAKLQLEGDPLSGTSKSIMLMGGQDVTKVLELYPGEDYDYENIGINFMDPNDPMRMTTCYVSAHFVPTAGKVNISTPTDKWVVNTESSYDSKKQQYYLPVTIDGFDVNYRNFDHIELQYKQSNKGESDWVNVCSYFADSTLMAKASGEVAMINGDGTISATFWGESDPIEQDYDLRAVNYCRYENGYLTRSSDVLSGVKDTRRPTLFGSAKPEDGVLDIGDDIMMSFSEDIAGNNLRDLNNFQVLGMTNSTNISLGTSLRFNGEEEAITQAQRNLGKKSFTVDLMVNPDEKGKAMTLFSHGNEDSFLELGLTADWKPVAVFKDAVFTANDTIPFDGLRQIAYVLDADDDAGTTTVTFFDGSSSKGSFTYNGLYEGHGKYTLGQHDDQLVNSSQSMENYEGNMLEFRLWNRAMSTSEMAEYSQKNLTGYELGLLDNFPLNEGSGDYSFNRVKSGGDLMVNETAWEMPNGIAMKLDGTSGFDIDGQKFSRSSYQDYSMMFWFRTTDANGTLLANGKGTTESNAKNHFNFGVENGQLYFRTGNSQLTAKGDVNDGQWHHAAVTVSHSRNKGQLYVDTELKNTFAVDTLGGISAETVKAGVTPIGGGKVENAINGHIDEIAMYEAALTDNLIHEQSSLAPTGTELGMLAYLSFAENELQLDNSQQLMPTGVSLKRYWDSTLGKYTSERDTLVAQSVCDALCDRDNHAPMRGELALENIEYSYVAKGSDLYMSLDVPDYQIEKTNVYITVKEIADLNGNTLESPVMMDLYVYRNPLRWNVKQLNLEANYGEELQFQATVKNLSGKKRQFYLESLPVWIQASETAGSVEALGEETITFTVSPFANVGDYDEVFQLVGSEDMVEPLPVNLKVRGTKPDWAVDDELKELNYSMHIVGEVNILGDVATDPDDMLATFNGSNRLLGVTNLTSEGLANLTVYNTSTENSSLSYQFYDASTGVIHVVEPSSNDAKTFTLNSVVGSSSDPVAFETNDMLVQSISLKKGWNWISLNVQPDDNQTFSELMGETTEWEEGDALEYPENGTYSTLQYKVGTDDNGNEVKTWDRGDEQLSMDPKQMYRFYSKSDKTAYIKGAPLDDHSVTAKNGWNRIGFTSYINLPIGTALADYTDQASDGDIIKGQNQFAMLSVDAAGNKSWSGTLETLRNGEGYMLKRNGSDDATFTYPTYYSPSRYTGTSKAPQQLFDNVTMTSMTVVAVADDVETQQGDVLTAWRGAELCGKAVADAQGVFYLNVADVADGALTDELTFTLERDDELVATAAGRQMRYKADAAYGTPQAPTAIRFIDSNNFDADGWYSVSGVKLQRKPAKSGVYIYNNEKVVIK